MAVKQRARPSPVRRRAAAAAAAAPEEQYQQGRAVVTLLLFLVFFALMWLVNGEWTADMVVLAFATTAAMGWAVHIAISVLELASAVIKPYLVGIPRWVGVVLFLLSLPFGLFDVYSSAVGVAPYLVWTGAADGMIHVQNTIMAEVVAFLPERMLLYLTIALYNTLRG